LILGAILETKRAKNQIKNVSGKQLEKKCKKSIKVKKDLALGGIRGPRSLSNCGGFGETSWD